jgi:hypothetical protein
MNKSIYGANSMGITLNFQNFSVEKNRVRTRKQKEFVRKKISKSKIVKANTNGEIVIRKFGWEVGPR